MNLMLKNLFLIMIGVLGGLWIVWPEIITKDGWGCVQDIATSQDEELSDYESFVESLPNKIRLGLSISPKAILRRDNLQLMDKVRIAGDACFR